MPSDLKMAELAELLSRLCDGHIDQTQWDRLESLLLDDPAAQDFYRRFTALDVDLAWRAAGRPAPAQFEPPKSVPFPAVVIPSSSAFPSPASSIGGFLFSYIVAAVIVGLGMLIGWICHVPVHQQVANDVSRPSKTPIHAEPEMVFVGRVTAMADCIWADANTATVNNARVPLGRKYALASGLLQITYDTGAKVILQGPCTFEVASAAGGHLALGRLTAKVETKAEGQKPKAEAGETRTHAVVKSRIAQQPSPLFSIRTPTALVTDLGTEFGVEVSKTGVTETRVFLGKAKIEGKGLAGNVLTRTLVAGQAAQFDPQKGLVDVSISANAENRFVHKMPAPKPSALDLIEHIDYSDTWSANSPTRTGSYLMLTTPESLKVEQCHGNPPRSWVLSRVSAMTTWPYDDSPITWPGFQVQGARSGFTETGIGGTGYFGFEYGLRDDFIVQFDAVQTRDRINITIGDKPATIYGDRSLSVFFRAIGDRYPEIGLHTPSKGEVNSGLRSGIPTAIQWHNYAVRFNLRQKRLTVWVDGKCRGTIDLAGVNTGMQPGATWASLPWTAKCVTIGGEYENGNGRLWTDNFRVGSPRSGLPESDRAR